MEVGGHGRPSVPVLSPVGWDFRYQSGDVTAPPLSMVEVHVWEKPVKHRSAQPNSTVQVWYLSAGEGQRLQASDSRPRSVFSVDGVWSEWSEWSACKYPDGRDIRCRKTYGSHSRVRECLHRAHNGSICEGDNLTERRACYYIKDCSSE